ncbi:hypothetical protein [Baaleninema sp.]|uniref:hypothetical protein n=1 Tax=Baaleninema sp. TaxID=3101197 RepID=UPI003D012FF9
MAKSDDLYVAEQALYEHLLDLVKVEQPDRLLDRFRSLFVQGSGYPDPEIAAIVRQISRIDEAEREFNSVLNRCCHILINHWQMDSKSQAAIPQLVSTIDTSGERRMHSREARRLQLLLGQFKESEEFVTLQRLVQVVDRTEDRSQPPEQRPLSTLIGRYPYLYNHSLLSDSSSYEHQQTIQQLQAKKQRQYEIHLSKYVTYKVRRAQLARQNPKLLKNQRIIKPVRNPTLLEDRELYLAVKQFAGRAEGSYTYKDLAQNFRTHTSQTRTYREFKEDLFEYLITTVDEEYGKRQFYEKLYQHLMNTLPQCDNQKPTDFLIIRTCSQLLNFLVVESPQNPNHYVLIDLLSNIGPTFVMALLLKILLICRKVRPHLEKRFAILFDHYDQSTREAVQWLIKSLENLQVALSTNFGSADLSVVSQAS